MNDGDVARAFHRETSYGGTPPRRPDVPGFVPMDPGNRPRPFKRYPEARLHALPAELPPPRGEPAAAALSGRVRVADPSVDPEFLARLLSFSAGVTRVAGAGDETTWFRAAPSAGNLR
ncbi:hypothetical protein [Micromonospora sp. NPDC049679]|uniref:hypothetical protein n=1 Tax=Micromonospora sp. NPDC049679 TaxID=3155920 RepID=UPI0033DC1BC6